MIRTSAISVLATSIVLIAATPGFAPPVFAQGTFQSSANGNWSSAGTWTLVSGSDADGIPDANDALEINAVTQDHIDMTRNNTAASADVGWFVVEFAQGVNPPALAIEDSLPKTFVTLSGNIITSFIRNPPISPKNLPSESTT